MRGPAGRQAVIGQLLQRDECDRDVGTTADTTGIGADVMPGILMMPNDGIIAAVETQSLGIDTHMTWPVTHTGLLVSPEVARQTALFLGHHRFNRQGVPGGKVQ